jgi:uncharacterized protein YciI
LLYALVAYDKPNGLKRRMEARPEHLKYLEDMGDQLSLAGAFLDADGGMVGSIVLIEAGSQEEAEATFNRDPYVSNDVFDSVTIKPFRIAINKTRAP